MKLSALVSCSFPVCRLRVSLEAVRGLFGYGLQSYQRLAAMGLAAMEARQSGPPPLTKCRESLVAVSPHDTYRF